MIKEIELKFQQSLNLIFTEQLQNTHLSDDPSHSQQYLQIVQIHFWWLLDKYYEETPHAHWHKYM